MGGTAKPAVWKEQQCKGLGVEQQHRHCTQSAAHLPWIGYGHRGDAAAWLVGAGKLLGGRGTGTGTGKEASPRGLRCCSGVGSAQRAGVRIHPHPHGTEPICVHVGQSQFMSTWITCSKVGAAPQLPLVSCCNVLSTAKSHVNRSP